MGLITPDYGLIFWMALSFSILLFLLKKYAWKTILDMIKNREETVAKALRNAELARMEYEQVEQRKVELLAEANTEKTEIVAEANRVKERIVRQAEEKAREEAQKILNQARATIQQEKESAQLEIKAYVSQIVMLAAERILRKELQDKAAYEEQIDQIIKELSSEN